MILLGGKKNRNSSDGGETTKSSHSSGKRFRGNLSAREEILSSVWEKGSCLGGKGEKGRENVLSFPGEAEAQLLSLDPL